MMLANEDVNETTRTSCVGEMSGHYLEHLIDVDLGQTSNFSY